MASAGDDAADCAAVPGGDEVADGGGEEADGVVERYDLAGGAKSCNSLFAWRGVSIQRDPHPHLLMSAAPGSLCVCRQRGWRVKEVIPGDRGCQADDIFMLFSLTPNEGARKVK